MLARSWPAVSAGPRAYLRPAARALDIPSIQHAWDLMREVQRLALNPPKPPVSGIRLIEKHGRLDVEDTRAWMEAYARRQFEAGRVTQDVVDSWETATPAEVIAWAVHEVRDNRRSVYLAIGKVAACGLAAFLSAGLVTSSGMAVMSSIVLMLGFIFFAFGSVRAIRNQAYLQSLTRQDGAAVRPADQKLPAGRLGRASLFAIL
jgi:membrane glycosyltransferase